MMTDKSDRDIDWQAFLYASGEMSPVEIEAFEYLLAYDQAAREALAAAAVLIGKLALARPPAPDTVRVLPTSEQRTRRLAAAVTIAASLLVYWSLGRSSPGPADPSGEEARELISFWSEAWPPGENDSLDGTADGDAPEAGIPSWMLAALDQPPPKATEEN
jgi:hypothetical protein